MRDYTVELDVFHGPMDLLLHLVRRQEVDVRAVSVSTLAGQFAEYVQVLRELQARGGLDIDVLGDYLVTAATLAEVKSRDLLPRPDLEPIEGVPAAQTADPRQELVRQLLEYKRFRDAAARLEALGEQHAVRHRREPTKRLAMDDDAPPPLDLEEVQVFDLLAAFTKLMGEVGRGKSVHEVHLDDTPLELHAADVEDRLSREPTGRLSLRQLFANRTKRGELIGVFLALLELIREKRVTVEADDEAPTDPSKLMVVAV